MRAWAAVGADVLIVASIGSCCGVRDDQWPPNVIMPNGVLVEETALAHPWIGSATKRFPDY
ncbi:hypothetical protein Nans01_47320 [Nocardiopsis ansamitocini]|uniref:Uncharacterized protein n=1 Tax=Nocardiopsis ansamitocini TaxID=1670832 RepID=A0A9W6PB14_9ACTN|nr:hypothetical protein Nans01_47320 [Nocardiopsis ansamitocini]